MFRSKIIILVVTLFTGHASAEGIQRIVGGSDVLINNYPYQVSVRASGRHFCGGSIVSERHILTAAHCIREDMKPPFSEFHVATGTSYGNQPGQIHLIDKVDVHPDWSNNWKESYPNDIAVITLTDKIIFDENQQKIHLPSHDFEDGRIANLTGWGLMQQVPQIIAPNQLQMIQTTLVSQEKCRQRLADPEKTKISVRQICTFSSKGSGACIGDSGGPLVADGEVVGVVSWGAGGYCGLGHPDVHTNVYKYKDYIESILYDSK